MQYAITLLAGIPKRQEMSGKTFLLLDLGAAQTLDLTIESAGGFSAEELHSVKRGLKLITQSGFKSALFTSAVDCLIQVVSSDSDISVNYEDGNNVNATIVGTPTVNIGSLPVPVRPDRGGTPAVPVYVSGVISVGIPANIRNDNEPIAVGPVAVQLLASNDNRIETRIANLSGNEIAIGGAGITWTNRVVVIGPGDVFIDDKAANLSFYAVTNAGNTAAVTTQEIIK